MSKVRSFIAIKMPNKLVESLGRLYELLQRDRLPMRLVDLQNVHLTLAFLGEVEEKLLEDLQPVLRQEVAKIQPFSVRLEGLGAFNSWAKARVLWIGCGGPTDFLENLHFHIREACFKIGFLLEVQEFSPHITIARSNHWIPLVVSEQCKVYKVGTLTIDTVTLIRSDLTPNGAIYTDVASFPLGKA